MIFQKILKFKFYPISAYVNFKILVKKSTVELGYNELGYSEIHPITNETQMTN